MKKRLSSLIAGFLVASQLLLSCAGIASVKAETPPGSGTVSTGDYLQGSYIKRVSVNSDGVGGNGYSLVSSLSADGRFVAFMSNSSNLVQGDTNGAQDIFVYDNQTGQTERVSVSSTEAENLNGATSEVKITPNGRYVAFVAYSTTLVPREQASTDVYIRDRWENTTILANTSSMGVVGNGVSLYASFGFSDNFVTFTSYASNLVPWDNNNRNDVFIRNLQSGDIERVSVASDGTEGDGDSSGTSWTGSSVSSDGRFVIFKSSSSNLISGETNSVPGIYIRDRLNNITKKVLSAIDSNQGFGVESLSISGDGNFVIFSSAIKDLVPGDNDDFADIFAYDVLNGTIKCLSKTRTDTGVGYRWHSIGPSVSADGRFVTFGSDASDLVSGDYDDKTDVFVYDLQIDKIERVSIARNGNGISSGHSHSPSISNNGRYISFVSYASDLVPNDSNNNADIFLMKNPLYPAEVTKTQCSDNLDNDGDGLIDAADASCHTDMDADNLNSYDATLDDESKVESLLLPPTELKQKNESDGSEVGVGKIINEGAADSADSVIFSGKVKSSDGGKVALEVQVARINESGNLTWFKPVRSDFVASGEIASIKYTPDSGLYMWQAMTVDEAGVESEWKYFGDNTVEADFISSNFSFVYLTDVHLGSNTAFLATADTEISKAGEIIKGDLAWYEILRNDITWYESVSYPRFTDVLYKIENMNPKPDFILIGGDNVEYNDERWLEDFKAITEDFSKRTGIEIYFVPGNHDRYDSESSSWSWEELNLSGGNDNLENYFRVMGKPEDVTSLFEDNQSIMDAYQSEKSGENRYNYYFNHDGFQFIGLDSGEDTGEENDFAPEGSGLSEIVIDKIKALEESSPDTPRIIFMHHPVYNGGEDPAYYERWGLKLPEAVKVKEQTKMDTGGVAQNAAITNHWMDFINECSSHNIQLILSGHEHKDPIFDKDGHPVYLSNWTEAENEEYPLYIQTQSAGKGDDHGYRVIDVKNGKAIPRESETNVAKYEKVVADLNPDNALELKTYGSDGKEITRGNDANATAFFAPSSKRTIIYDDVDQSWFKVVNAASSANTYNLTLQKREQGAEIDHGVLGVVPASGYTVTNSGLCSTSNPLCMAFLAVRNNSEYTILDFQGVNINSNATNSIGVDWGKIIETSFSEFSKIEGVQFVVGDNYETWYVGLKHWLTIDLNSPGELRVFKDGKVTGMVDGEVVENIPNSIYAPESETVYIFGNTRQEIAEGLRTQVVGSYEATYDLSIALSEDGQEENKFMADDVLINGDTTHQFSVDWDILEQGGKGVKMEIDGNKDGIFNDPVFLDKTLSFPKANVGAGVENYSVSSVEGTKITFDGSGSSDTDGSIAFYEWDFDGDGTYNASSTEKTVDYAYGDDFAGKVFLKVTDDEGLTNVTGVDVKISNAAPVINSIEDKTIEISDPVNLETGFTDAGTADTHTASIDWGDGVKEDIILATDNPKNISASHTYGALGTYNATLSVKDDDGAVAAKSFAVVVTKRATTLAYDGETSGGYGDTIKLSATLADRLGGLVNKNVTFQLGAQTVSAVTDGSGKAVAEMNINQIMESYPVKVTFQEDNLYLTSETQAQLTVKSIKQVKQEALAKLKTLASLSRQKDIQKAAADLEDALAPKLWMDDFRLNAQYGQKVFDNEKEAVKGIQKFIKDRKMPVSDTVKADLESVIDSIIFSDKALIDTVLTQAKDMAVKNSKFAKKRDEEIKKSEAELADALREIKKGNEDKAIDAFKKAWDSVQLAIEFALK